MQTSPIMMATPRFLADLGVLEQPLWLLEKALYGLRESPKAWQITRDKELGKMKLRLKGKTFKLQRSGADPSVWFVVDASKTSDEPLAVILAYVGDFLMTGPQTYCNEYWPRYRRCGHVGPRGS